MEQNIQAIIDLVTGNSNLSAEEKATIITKLKETDKKITITEFKLDSTEKVKRTTAILLEETIKELEQKRKAVEAQNHELEIEASLERVRVVAMGMMKPDDMLAVCRTISNQLELLAVKEIRNVQTAIFYKQKGAYMNYEYYTKHDKTFITETTYTNNEIHEAFAQKMLKGNGEFFITHIKGDEVKEWIDYQKTTNVFIDTFLETASSLNYYWYSLGPVALGISTYSPLNEEETNLFRRFLKVFELAYTRYLDIEQAIAQAREAQIQLALERVRARTMAMHKSDELSETAVLLYKQLYELGNIPSRINIGIVNDKENIIEWWITGQAGKQINTKFTTKMPGPAFLTKMYGCWKEQKKSIIIDSSGKELADWFNYLRSELGGNLNEGLIKDRMVSTVASFTNGIITITTPQPAPKETITVLERFAGVFNLTYRRFLDLQKAEAQAREAQIEAALEKVRSRTMAMHKSEELIEVIASVFQQLEHLSFRIDSANLFLNYKENPFKFWMAVPGYLYPSEINVPYGDFALMNRFIREIKSNATLVTAKFNQEEKNEWVRHLIQHTIIGNSSDEKKKHMFEAPGLAMSVAGVKNIALAITNYSVQSYSDEENEILRRFVIVFDQTYTRFLDLQKAEAQARESQIEAALERVRSRSMGMQKSDELKEVIQVVYEQFVHLNIHVEHTGFVIDYKTRDDYDIWIADQLGVPSHVTIPYFDCVYYNRFNEAKKKGEDFFATSLDFEEKNRFYKKIIEYVPGLPEETKEFLFSIPGLAGSTVLLDNVCLYIENFSGIPYSDEENNTLMRFGKVFQQTYTRFLDLQKAEAQAKESQIEAALERVRSRSMGMQKSEELRDVIQVIHEQLVQLNFEISNAGFLMDYRESDDGNIWMTDATTEFPTKQHLPWFDHPFNDDYLEQRDKGPELFTKVYPFEEKNTWWEVILKYLPAVSEETKKALLGLQALALSRVLMKNIGLYLLNYTGTPYSEAENATLMRFGKVFEQTYTRFNDLKKAEAQALEAIKRASVDRVRAEIASMRTTNDLERITPLIWNELTTLGVPFIRCGVFIMDDEQQQIETHLSTPDGRAIATFNLPYNAPGETAEILAHWHKKELYKQHWNETQFVEFTQNLVQQGAITSGEKYLAENRATDLRLHFLPFLQGMLYVGNTATLSDDALQLVQNLADAFSTAYARYEDFNKLEAAKKQVDSTLNKLQATQKQLIQSEKMASLGELTAGIAHEIQNPLNFVNNFSEVNQEMIDEATEEIDKGNIEEVKNILSDIKDNSEKINHHGKRADAIVKGMLQHSRKSEGIKEPTDINALCDEYLRLSYHGLRAKDKSFNVDFKTDFDESIGKINIIPQDIGRVLLNLINNAFYAVNEKSKNPGGFENPRGLETYRPFVSIQTKKLNARPDDPVGRDKIEVSVADNGYGIPQNIVDKIFQPFFTTKPTGQGTGLGLSLSYDIVKAHGGEIKVISKNEEGSTFIIQLPVE